MIETQDRDENSLPSIVDPQPISEKLNSISAFNLQPFDPKNPDYVDHLTVRCLEGGNRSEKVHLREFEVRLLNKDGVELEPPKNRRIEFRHEQDVLDLLPYYEADGKVQVIIYEAIRPAIAARALYAPNSPMDDRPEYIKPVTEGKIWQMPGSYILSEEGQTGIHDASDRLLLEKLGLQQVGPLEILEGAYFPSVGGATELAFPRAIKVMPLQGTDLMGFGQDFYRSRRVRAVELQTVIDEYFKGEIQDLRLVEGVFRLAAQKGIELKIPNSFSSQLSKNPIPTGATVLGRVVSGSDLADELRKSPTSEQVPAFVDVHLTDNPSAKIFMRGERIEVKNINSQGEELDTYEADVILRQGIDSVDVGAYYWQDDKLFMVIKRGVRAAIAARNLAAHPIQTDASVLNPEGIAGSLEGENTLEGLKTRAIAELIEETGMSPESDPVFVGFEYPSAGFNPERSYRLFVEVDPTKPAFRPQGIDETIDVWCVEVNDVLALAERGIIRDPRLALSANLIKASFGYPSRKEDTLKLTHDEKLEFLSIIHSGSELESWLKSHARETDNWLSKVAEYRHVKAMRENEGGILIKSFAHPDEVFFFAALFDVFAIPQPQEAGKFTPIPQANLAERIPFALLHDLRHYSMGDLMPYRRGADGKIERDQAGNPKIIDFEEYRLGVSGNECEAVWYSDVYIPSLIGFDKARRIFDGPCLGEQLADLGLSVDDSRKLIVSIERDGHIPDEILTHPKYSESRAAIVDHLLSRYVIDREHIRVRYENWRQHPELAEIALRFMPHKAFTSRAEHEANFIESHKKIKNYVEGVNPVQAAIARTINRDIFLVALKLGYLKELIEGNAMPGADAKIREADACLANLAKARDDLAKSLPTIKHVELSPSNVKALRKLKVHQEGAIACGRAILEGVAHNPSLLTAEQIENMEQRAFPYLDPYPHDIKQEWRDEIAKLEQDQLIRAGKSA